LIKIIIIIIINSNINIIIIIATAIHKVIIKSLHKINLPMINVN